MSEEFSGLLPDLPTSTAETSGFRSDPRPSRSYRRETAAVGRRQNGRFEMMLAQEKLKLSTSSAVPWLLLLLCVQYRVASGSRESGRFLLPIGTSKVAM